MKNPDASSWVIKVNDLLSKYDLPSAFQLLDDLPTKFVWKHRISEAISSYWTKRYLELASMYSSLKFNYGRCSLQNSHIILNSVSRALGTHLEQLLNIG